MEEVPWDPLYDSVEIWRWVGGQSRKHKATGRQLERQYFQVYHPDDAYALNPAPPIPGDPIGMQAMAMPVMAGRSARIFLIRSTGTKPSTT